MKRLLTVLACLGLMVGTATPTFADDVTTTVGIDDYTQISRSRISRFVYEFVYQARATNNGSSLIGVSATLPGGVPAGVTLVDDTLSFGGIDAGASTTDTFSFRINRGSQLELDDLSWQVDGSPAITGGLLFGAVVDTAGNPVAGATVQIGTNTVTTRTAADGSYSAAFGVSEIASGDLVLLSTHPAGFAPAQTRRVLNTSDNTFAADLVVKAIDAQTLITDPSNEAVVLKSATAELNIPAGTILDDGGVPVTEPVTITLTALDPTDPDQRVAAPGGDFAATDPASPGEDILLESIVMADVTITGDSGTAYSRLAAPVALDMRLPDSEQAGYSPGDSIPLWFYDDQVGIWVREGEATVFANPTDSNALWARVQASHFSWWNCDIALVNRSCLLMEPRSLTGTALTFLNWGSSGDTYSGDWAGQVIAPNQIRFNVKRSATPGDNRALLAFEASGTRQYLVSGSPDSLTTDRALATRFDTPTTSACTDLGQIEFDLNLPPVVVLDPQFVTIPQGGAQAFTATISDPDGNLGGNPSFNWSNNCLGIFSNDSLAGADFTAPFSDVDCTVTLAVEDALALTGHGNSYVVVGAGSPGGGSGGGNLDPFDSGIGIVMLPGSPGPLNITDVDVIGGSRTLEIITGGMGTSAQVSSGVLSVDSSLVVSSSIRVSYDRAGVGLGGVDLTDGSSNDTFTIAVASVDTGLATALITVFDMGGNSASVSITLSTVGFSAIPFSSFVENGAGITDFTFVDAIFMDISLAAGVEITLDSLGTRQGPL